VLTLAGINLVIMVNVAVVVETVFAWPGSAGCCTKASPSGTSRGPGHRPHRGAMIVIVNFLVDILYAVIDPRIRYER